MKKSNRMIVILVVFILLVGYACSLTGVGDEPVSVSAPEVEATEPVSPMPSDTGGTVVDLPLCPGDPSPLVTDFEVRQASSIPEPSTRTPFRDPVFGTCLVRVTDRGSDLLDDDTSAGIKNEYSRVQSFNADESMLLARSVEAYWYLYDVGTLQPLGRIPIEAEPRWDEHDPNKLYFTDETRLMDHNVRTGETSLVHDFAADLPGQTLAAVWTRYEGRPSLDTRYWGFMAEDQDWQATAFLIYDLQSDQVIAKRDMRGVPGVEEDIDHVTVSPLGNYFLASFDLYCERGQLGDDAHPCGLMVYDRSLSNGRSLLRIVGHYDTALDATGREVIIFQDIDEDKISMLDLATGQATELWSIDFSHTGIGFHFSGCAFRRPGWALVSTYDGDPTAYTWMDDQVFAVELKADGRVVRLAHTHSLVDDNQEHDYWAEPHASVNRDFTRVIFTTNWGRSGTGEVEMFMIALPSDWSE